MNVQITGICFNENSDTTKRSIKFGLLVHVADVPFACYLKIFTIIVRLKWAKHFQNEII